MYSQTTASKLRAARPLACVFAIAIFNVASASQRANLSQIYSWLPDSFAELELVFSFDSEDAAAGEIDSRDLRKAIDRVGPTVVVVQARTAYDDAPRLIGGYNPYHWRDRLGRYEDAPGRFVFDLDKGRKWERQQPRSGFAFRAPTRYGLAFGNGDLVINSDLRSGSARNATFASAPNRSVLLGEATEFQVDAIRVFRVDFTPSDAIPKPYAPHWKSSGYQPSPDNAYYPQPIPDQDRGRNPTPLPGRKPVAVSDNSSEIGDFAIALAALLLALALYRRA